MNTTIAIAVDKTSGVMHIAQSDDKEVYAFSNGLRPNAYIVELFPELITLDEQISNPSREVVKEWRRKFDEFVGSHNWWILGFNDEMPAYVIDLDEWGSKLSLEEWNDEGSMKKNKLGNWVVVSKDGTMTKPELSPEDRIKNMASREMRLYTIFHIHNPKTRARVLNAFRAFAKSNDIEVDIHLDADDEEHELLAKYNSTIRLSIFGSLDECKTAFDKIRSMVPKKDGYLKEFTAPVNSDWRKKYSEYLYNTQPD